MKIGEIKKESLLLIFPEIEARFDAENDKSVNEGISALKCDPSLRAYLESCVPSINRAICEIEKVGATKTKRAVLDLSDTHKAVDLSKLIPDFLRACGIYQNGKALEYTMLDSYVLIEGASSSHVEVIYKSSVEKVRYISEESKELDLDFCVASLIPYFVAAELCWAENAARAGELKAEFFKGLGAYSSKIATQGEVKAVYSW